MSESVHAILRMVMLAPLTICIVSLTTLANAQDYTASWAKRVGTGAGVIGPQNALCAPDGAYASFDGPPAPTATYDDFGTPTCYLGEALASFLGVPEADLAQADFIVFEFNGNLDLPFETSSWTFSDGTNSVSMHHSASSPGSAYPILSVQGIDNTNYGSFFGFTAIGGYNQALLFDLPSNIDPRSPTFSVIVSASGNPPDATGSPDPDGMAVLFASQVSASEMTFNSTPPNPPALRTGLTTRPILGAIWDPWIDHGSFRPSATMDILAVDLSPSRPTVFFVGGMNPGVVPVIGTRLVSRSAYRHLFFAAPGSPFQVPIPADCSLLGRTIRTQGASLVPGPRVYLTNGIEITIGNL